ncbi:MAG: DNA polymerase III subunit delta [Lachnospiraceae bacterium]|nr:DNA polymerase III subunit delta [Lachnospiraceae bacterium]
MKKLSEEIKSGQLKQVYILYGEEAYLRNQYKDKLKNALLGDGDAMNFHYFEGKDVKSGEVIDLAQTMPFLAERRVLMLENSGLFSHGGEELAEYMAEISQTAYFVFVEPAVDKRSKLYKAATAKGRAIEFKAQDETTLKRWILGFLKKENKNITEKDLNLFLDKTGSDMDNIRGELEKLLCYCMERDVVTAQDIEAVCTKQVSSQIFDMINAVAERRQKTAMDLYYDLLTLKEPPMRILFLITRQFNLLLQVKELKNKGYDTNTIGEKVGLAGFIARKYVAQAAKFKEADLRRALTDCVEAEEAVKTGRMNDVMSVELLIVKYSAAS